MEKLLLAIGVALLGCAIVAAGMYAWNGHWLPVLLAISAAFVGKMALGLVEILLTPISLPMLYFAKRGNTLVSSIFAILLGLIGRAAFAAYCIVVLLYYVRIPGPPTWLAVALAIVVASAPFAWAAQRAPDDAHPSHFDLVAAMLGVAISGGLLAFGIDIVLALSPIAILFSISAIGLVIWWAAKGAPQARLQHFMDRGFS
jgi:hypothetical protein